LKILNGGVFPTPKKAFHKKAYIETLPEPSY
jgi:hypothetical protein